MSAPRPPRLHLRVPCKSRLQGVRLERPTPTLLIVQRQESRFVSLSNRFLSNRFQAVTVIGRDVEGGARFTVTGESSFEVNLDSRCCWPPARPWRLGVLEGSPSQRRIVSQCV